MLFVKFLLSTATCSWILTSATVFTWLRVIITNARIKLQVDKQEGLLLFPETWVWLPILKFLDKIFDCPACMGFWIGLLFYPLMPWEIDYTMWPFHGIMGSGCSLVFHRLAKFLNK